MDRLNALAREREDEAVRLREEQAHARDARRQARERLDRELARLDEEVRRNSQELMRAWKSGKTTARRALKEMAGLRAGIRKPEEQEAPAPFRARVGDAVRHRPWDRLAVVMDLDGKEGRAKIDMNGVTLWTSLSDLETAGPSAPDRGKGGITARVSRPVSLLRLDLRGKRADLAIMELEHFLDRALLAGPEGVEILHGRGTGALRKAVRQFLQNYPGLASYATAPDEQGGDGVTLVSFR
jgi:DNA mismatch repair protein MutS2